MCGACGRSVVSDPVLGPTRTLRQHLIVAQTINAACQSWPGAPKVAATSGGWLVSGPTGATEAVSTVEALWTTVLRGRPGVQWQDLRAAADLETGTWARETGKLGLDTGRGRRGTWTRETGAPGAEPRPRDGTGFRYGNGRVTRKRSVATGIPVAPDLLRVAGLRKRSENGRAGALRVVPAAPAGARLRSRGQPSAIRKQARPGRRSAGSESARGPHARARRRRRFASARGPAARPPHRQHRRRAGSGSACASPRSG